MTIVDNYKLLNKAVKFLRDDNLVWSADFDAIRKPLSDWLADEMRYSMYAADKAVLVASALMEDKDA